MKSDRPTETQVAEAPSHGGHMRDIVQHIELNSRAAIRITTVP